MKQGKEITVELDTDLETLKGILAKQNFKIIKEYDINDIYMVDRKCDLTQNPLDILSDCLLIRNIDEKDEVNNMITYKWKDYNENEEITKQGEVNCVVESLYDAEHLLNIIGFIRIFEIRDHLIIYSNGITEFAVQLVNDKHIYIELEDTSRRSGKYYETIEEMKEEINKLNIPIKGDNYFVKKALAELRDVLAKS